MKQLGACIKKHLDKNYHRFKKKQISNFIGCFQIFVGRDVHLQGLCMSQIGLFLRNTCGEKKGPELLNKLV